MEYLAHRRPSRSTLLSSTLMSFRRYLLIKTLHSRAKRVSSKSCLVDAVISRVIGHEDSECSVARMYEGINMGIERFAWLSDDDESILRVSDVSSNPRLSL